MIELIFTMLLGIISGVLSGLMPGVPIFLGFLLFLPFVPIDPMMILIYGVVTGIGSQFFGSMAVLYFKVPGESSSFPVLLELKNISTPEKIYHAIKLTTLGSLIATVIAATTIYLSLTSKLFSGMYMPILAKLSVFIFLVILSIVHDKKFKTNILILLLCLFFAFYPDVVIFLNTVAGQKILPMYYFNSMLALIIIFVMQLIWAKPVRLDEASETKKVNLPVMKNIPSMIKYSFLGTILGFIPQLGATVASYVGYNWEKFRKRDALQRITASETANNSAIITCWFPLLLMGVPITATELLLLQHYNKFGYNFSFLKTGDAALLLFVCMVVAAMIFYALAVLVNHKLYNSLGKIICRKWFSVLIAVGSLTIFYFIDRHSLSFIVTHLLIFIPVSWLISRLEINMLALVIGLLLVKDIFFTFLQVIQIYF